MNGSDSDKGSGIDRIEHGMDAFKKIANAREALLFRKKGAATIQLAQVCASRKASLARARKNANRSLRPEYSDRGREFFQLDEHGRTDFICRLVIQCQLDHPCAPFPTQRFAGKGFHRGSLTTVSRSSLTSYMASISVA